MTRPADATSPLKQPVPPQPVDEELDEEELERVSGGTDASAKDMSKDV
jgi:bacteriocin-like protein